MAIQEVFLKWKAEVENQSGHRVKYLRTDGGGEYEREVKKFLHTTGVKHEPAPPYTHESNGMAERLNRTLNTSARAMLIQANMPQQFWAEAILTAAEIKNMLPHSAFGDDDLTSPYERWHNKSPPLQHQRPFGCIVYALIPEERRPPGTKFLQRANKGCLIKSVGTSIYRYYDFRRQCFDESHDVDIKEFRFPTPNDFAHLGPAIPSKVRRIKSTTKKPTPMESESESESENEQEPMDEIIVEPYRTLVALFDPTYEPRTFQEAIQCDDAAYWIEAMKDEIHSMLEKNAFTLSDLPPGHKCIGCKWVYQIKRDANNKFKRFRARIVAKGFSQISHIDFEETFSPVIRIDSIRQLFAIAAFYSLHMIHADVKTAFINGKSDVELYLEQIPGFIDERHPHKVLRINRSLYGMKQASRIWYLLLCKTITIYGFEQLISDPCIFISRERRIIIAVYVDDILIFGPDAQECQTVYDYLAQHFQMNNLSEPTTFLGLNVSRNWQKRTITINQDGYIDHLLQRFQMENCIPVSIPLNRSLPLRKRQPHEKPANRELYQEMTGSLMHLAVYSRPDIAFAVSKLSQFNNDPSQTHLKAARHVLRYLKKTRELSITYGGQMNAGLNFKGYADASHASDLDD